MGNKSTKTTLGELKPQPGQLIIINNPGRGIYTYGSLKLDFGESKATSWGNLATNVYLGLYKTILGVEIPYFVVCVDDMCHTYFIKGNCLYKSNKIYETNESESVSLRECLSESFATFGDGSFAIEGIPSGPNPLIIR